MSLILNFLTEISIIEGGSSKRNPKYRIDDVEAESCLNVIIYRNDNLRLMQIRDMCSVYGSYCWKLHPRW
jgi:hypothetical protein